MLQAHEYDQEKALASVSARTRVAYKPFLVEAMRVSWLPYSTTSPSLITAILSASLIVERR